MKGNISRRELHGVTTSIIDRRRKRLRYARCSCIERRDGILGRRVTWRNGGHGPRKEGRVRYKASHDEVAYVESA
jgi:hypothetical protein